MGHPRFLIVNRPSRPDLGSGGTVWRLLGANNRHLGQSQETFRDAVACRAAIEDFQSRVDQGRATISSLDRGQLWLWRLELDGRTVACSARGYRRQRECQYNLARFLAGVHSLSGAGAGAGARGAAEADREGAA